MIIALLLCVAGLFVLAIAAVPLAGTAVGRRVVYGGALGVTALAAVLALVAIGAVPAALTLPLGLAWQGAHFRLDALAAFFLLVVNLGAAAASSTRWDTGGTRRRRTACCHSIRRSWRR